MRTHPYLRCAVRLGLLPLICLALRAADAGSATWDPRADRDWHNVANWNPATVPDGPADIATFASSPGKTPEISTETEVSEIVIAPGVTSWNLLVFPNSLLNPSLTISGAGMTNNSGLGFTVQLFEGISGQPNGKIFFINSATAGDLLFYNIRGSFNNSVGGTFIQFLDNSNAGSSSFTLVPGNEFGGVVEFLDQSSAANATFVRDANSTAEPRGGILTFADSATAANATLIANPGVAVPGGLIEFLNTSSGGTAQVQMFGNGMLDLASHDPPGLTLGSLESEGIVSLGANSLTVGSNNLSTTFSGTIQDTGGGSLTKTGSGTLTLSGTNTYTGGTAVNSGVLLATNTTGSATGTGAVNVTRGTLGGSGIISGGVIVGTGNGPGANLAPALGSSGQQATLTLQSSLTVQADTTYIYSFKARTNQSRTDLVLANGVTINGATIKLKGKAQGTLTPGTVLTVINNTSANPISGTFSNLADGAIVTVNGNNFQASYSGGDGNDLTLTVVP